MLAKPDAEKDRTARIRKLAADLDDDDFDVREAATAALVKVGPACALRHANPRRQQSER